MGGSPVMPSGAEVAAKPLPDSRPAVQGGLDAIAGAVHAEEGVPGAVVGGELMILAQAGQLGIQFRRLIRGREAVVGAEQAEQRAGEVRGEADQGRELEWRLRRWRAHDPRAVAVDRGVEGELAGGEEALPPPGAVADDAELAVGGGQGAQMAR